MKFFIFFVFSFIVISIVGWSWELFLRYCETKMITRDSFLKGPWCIIYGFSVSLLFPSYFLFENFYIVVTLGLIESLFLQLSSSIAMEYIFKRKWWDYSDHALNYKGRFSLKSISLLTIFSTLSIYFLIPLLEHIILAIPFDYLELFTWIILFVLLIDIIISSFIELTSTKARKFINESKIK